ncbi:MAG: hypothetical protein RIS76_661 [Verrucomicrobiota bacterium]|jgi:hypothetical protein
MKPLLLPHLLTALLATAVAIPASAQSVGRIRKSLDKATGGATKAATPSTPAPAGGAPAASSQAQIAANEAAANKRNKAAQVGVDSRVITFLKQRVEEGSVDAPVDLAKRYEEGKGVEADPVEARRLYTLGAERGNEEAKVWLENNPAPEKPPTEAAPVDPNPLKSVPPAQEKTDAPAPAPAPNPAPATPAPKP